MERALLTFPPSFSKRLITRAVSGMPVGMVAVTGEVVTECRALETMACIRARNAAIGGVARRSRGGCAPGEAREC